MAKDQKNILHAIFTMDCLPAGGRAEVQGAERWDHAAASVMAFAECLSQEGFGATLFVAPEALARLGKQLRELQSAGCELGMVCHPQLSHYQAYLGAYNFDRQREIVQLGRALWENALGEAPTTFRPGFFSANDYTYHVLCMEGFEQGSCSLPGRVDNEQCSVWPRSYPFAHHTDPLDRTAQGTMEFFEVPVTSDFEAAPHVSFETYTPPHLRIEEPDVHEYARDLVMRQARRMLEDNVTVPTVTFVTSNVVGWHRGDDPHVDRLHNLCQMLREVAEELELELTSSSVAAVHAACDEQMGSDLELDDAE